MEKIDTLKIRLLLVQTLQGVHSPKYSIVIIIII